MNERERKLGTLLTSVHGMAYRCAVDANGMMEFTSSGCEEIAGYSREALIGDAEIAFDDLIAAEHREVVRRERESALAHGDAWTLNFPIVTASGDTKWVCEHGAAVCGVHGEVLAREGLVVDIDSCSEADDLLMHSVSKWRETFDAIHDSLSVFDAEGRIQHCNAATCTFTGRGFEDLLGQPCFSGFHGTCEPVPDCPRILAMASGPGGDEYHGDGWTLAVGQLPSDARRARQRHRRRACRP